MDDIEYRRIKNDILKGISITTLDINTQNDFWDILVKKVGRMPKEANENKRKWRERRKKQQRTTKEEYATKSGSIA